MNLSDKFTIIIPPQDISCDKGCLQKLAGGDREAYAWVYKNYCKKVYDFALLMTNNKQHSEDLVQEVFLRLWKNRAKLSTVENFNGYLYRLQKNLVLNVMRQQQTEMISREKYFFASLQPVIRADEKLEQKELAACIEKKVSLLPSKQQEVYRLAREKGLQREKIAKLLNISPFTVKCHMQKALKSLRLGMGVRS